MTEERDDVVLAGELSLRLLGEDEADVLRARVARDPAFARQVALWDEAFAGLAPAGPTKAPPPRVKAAIDDEIRGGAPVTRSAPANDDRWKLAAAALATIALVELGLLLRPQAQDAVVTAEAPPEPTIPSEPYVAALVPSDAAPPIVVRLDLPQGLLSVDPTGLEAGDRAVQLWILPADGGAPVSLGLLAPNRDNTVEVPIVLSGLGSDELPSLAISLEPQGGSPTGLPTGPVVAAGQVTRAAPQSPSER